MKLATSITLAALLIAGAATSAFSQTNADEAYWMYRNGQKYDARFESQVQGRIRGNAPSAWARPGWEKAKQSKVVRGYTADGTDTRPQALASREEVVSIAHDTATVVVAEAMEKARAEATAVGAASPAAATPPVAPTPTPGTPVGATTPTTPTPAGVAPGTAGTPTPAGASAPATGTTTPAEPVPGATTPTPGAPSTTPGTPTTPGGAPTAPTPGVTNPGTAPAAQAGTVVAKDKPGFCWLALIALIVAIIALLLGGWLWWNRRNAATASADGPAEDPEARRLAREADARAGRAEVAAADARTRADEARLRADVAGRGARALAELDYLAFAPEVGGDAVTVELERLWPLGQRP